MTPTGLSLYDPPAHIEMARPFWDAIADGRLVLPRCSVCGAWQWYPEAEGTDCAGGALAWEPVAVEGALYSFTRVHRSFLPGGRSRAPYVVGLIDLDGLNDLDGVDGPRLVATLEDDAGLAVGARVRAGFVGSGAGASVVFALVAGAGAT